MDPGGFAALDLGDATMDPSARGITIPTPKRSPRKVQAFSAPVMRMPPPPPPPSRPQVALNDPPPMELPPSPPVFSQMQLVQAQQGVEQFKQQRAMSFSLMSGNRYMGDRDRTLPPSIDFRMQQQQLAEGNSGMLFSSSTTRTKRFSLPFQPPSLGSFHEGNEQPYLDNFDNRSRATSGVLSSSPTIFSMLTSSPGSSDSSNVSARTAFSTMSSLNTTPPGTKNSNDHGKKKGGADEFGDGDDDNGMMFAISLGPDDGSSFLQDGDDAESARENMESLFLFDGMSH